MSENFIWEVKSEQEAFDKLFEIYDIDEFNFVHGDQEAGKMN